MRRQMVTTMYNNDSYRQSNRQILDNLSCNDLVSHEKSSGTKCVPEMEKAPF